MNGHFFLVGYLNYFPYFSCAKEKPQLDLDDGNITIICAKGVGVEGELLDEMSRRLNFTYKLVNFGDSSPKSFFDVFEKVVGGSLDFAVGGITRTRTRTTRALFTATIDREDYNIFYIYRIPEINLILNALYPFKYTLWIAIIVSIFLLSAGLYFYIRAKRCGSIPVDYFYYFSVSINLHSDFKKLHLWLQKRPQNLVFLTRH
ncbi:hypothetical protein QE152_g39459 [Popillia japonica]|uniref:Solute-binding protein family 3/N-terminal domain-containing protein n=1 Tax=Popillia japonica TaxID=7064 RepID=A0AAW1HUQ1_POPJA